jgi:hypothetical protein
MTVVLNLKDRPPKTRSKRADVIAQLLDRVSELVRASRSQGRQHEIIEVPLRELPPALQLYFNSITLLYFPVSNPGAVVQRRKFEVSLNPSHGGIAICSFHQRLYEKAIVGAEKYSIEKQGLGLEKLWLILSVRVFSSLCSCCCSSAATRSRARSVCSMLCIVPIGLAATNPVHELVLILQNFSGHSLAP